MARCSVGGLRRNSCQRFSGGTHRLIRVATAGQWQEYFKKGIDYRKEEYLGLFKDIPLYIFHGKEDLNCPFRLTEKPAESLKAQNPRVETRFTENGHSGMGKEDEDAFIRWLGNL